MLADNRRNLVPVFILGLCMALFCLGSPAPAVGDALVPLQDGNFQVQTSYSFPVTEDRTVATGGLDDGYYRYTFTVRIESTEGEPFLTRPETPNYIYTSWDFDWDNVSITIENAQIPYHPASVTFCKADKSPYGNSAGFYVSQLHEGTAYGCNLLAHIPFDIIQRTATVQAEYRDDSGEALPVYEGTEVPGVYKGTMWFPFIAGSRDMGDIFNAEFNLRVLKVRDKISIIPSLISGRPYRWDELLEPAPGIDLRLLFVWDIWEGENRDVLVERLAYYPAGEAGWQTSGADGWSSFTTSTGAGAGSEVFFDNLRVHADALNVAVGGGSYMPSDPQYNSYPALKNFSGDLKVTVKDPYGEPLDDIEVFVWGGHGSHAYRRNRTAEGGKVDLEIGSLGTSSQTLEVTLYPSVDLRWNLTQAIDNPRDIVLDHRAPLFISPEPIVERGFFDNPFTEIHGVWIELYDLSEPEKVIARSRPQSLASEYTRDRIQKADHRAYLPIDPSRLRSLSEQARTQEGTAFGLRAMLEASDVGDVVGLRKLGSMSGALSVTDRLLTVSYRKARKQGFTVGFVPLRTGAWSDNPFFTQEWGDIHNPGQCLNQIEFARQFFPSGINSSMHFLTEYYSIHPMSIQRFNLRRIFHGLDRMQKRWQDKVDFIVGIVPPGFLGAAGLAMDGVTGAVLFDPSEAGRNHHIVIHEFLHTLKFRDVYPSDEVGSDFRKGWRPLSADGHDRRPFNNYELEYAPWSFLYGFHTRERLMYDQPDRSWPSGDEYTAFLDYATVPAATATASPLSSNGDEGVQNVLVISGEIVETWNPGEGPGKRVSLDPVFSYRGAVNRGSGETDLTVLIVDGEGNELERGYIGRPAGYHASIPLWPFDYETGDVRFMVSLPDHLNKAAIEIRQNGDLLERYDYGESPPGVTLIGPMAASLSGPFDIAWSASGEETKRLYSTLMISSDDGAAWEPVAMETVHDGPGDYSHPMNADLLPSGDAYRFKVILSDGLRESEAVSAQSHTISGYDASPKLVLAEEELAVTVTAGDRDVSVFLVIGNEGEEELTVRFDGESFPPWVSPKAAESDVLLFGGREKLLRIDLELPVEAPPEEQFLQTVLRLFSNDPDKEETDIPLVVNYADSRPAPQIVYVETRPEAISKGLWPLDMTFDVTAYASAGNRHLEAEVTIELLGGAPVVDREPMTACNHEWGAYLFFWDPSAGENGLEQGEYGVKIFLKDPETGLERNPEDYDIIVTLRDNRAPVLNVNIVEKPEWMITQDEEWNQYFLDNLEIGDELRISYIVSDPDGDDVTVRVVSSLPEQDLLLAETDGGGKLSWTAASGEHFIYLIAEDTHGSTAQVLFGINCHAAEDDDPSPPLPPPPVLETKSGTLDGDSIVIEGTAPPNAAIRITVRGGPGTEPVKVTGPVFPDGSFSIEIPLSPGENTILVTYREYVEAESQPAEIFITTPEGDGSQDGHPDLALVIAILQVLAGQEVPSDAFPPSEFFDGRPLGLQDVIGIMRHNDN